MAGCGELDQTLNALTSSKQTEKVAGDPLPSTSPLECAICLQTCVHPVRLPCHHVFCFLCVKGASWHSKRCALCRQDVPEGFLASPTLLSPGDLKAAAAGGVSRGSGGGGAGDDGSRGDRAWYYEGHNGWWQYDERTGRELEEAFAKGRSSAEMLIAGFVYVADLERMVQYLRNARGRRRRMKRDAVGIPKKGVAGLRLDPEPAPLLPPVPAGCASSADGAHTTGRSQFPGLGDLVSAAPPVRQPTLLGAPLDRPQSPPPSASLEQALSQLLISQEGAEEGRALSGGQSDELSSSEGEEGGRSDGRMPGEELWELPAGRMSPRGGPSSSMLGARPYRTDGQCTVTQV